MSSVKHGTTLLLALFLPALLLQAVAVKPAAAEPRHYQIDPGQFSIAFKTHHLGYQDVIGLFLEASGSFVFDETVPAVSDVVVEIQSSSIFTNNQARDDHLVTGDFLDTENHPTIRFTGTDTQQTGERTGTITGDLTILGTTREETFDLTWNKSGPWPFGIGPEGGPPYVVGISATGAIKRSDFGSTYAVDNGWVGDEIDIMIEFQAIRQPQ